MKYCSNKNGFNSERIDIYFSKIDPGFGFNISKTNNVKADRAIGPHLHKTCIEFIFMDRGSQTYIVNDEAFNVESGHVLIVFPNELHSTGQNPREKSIVYYFRLTIGCCREDVIGYDKDDIHRIISSINNIEKRLFKGSSHLRDVLENLIDIYFSEIPFAKTRIRNLVSDLLITILEGEKEDNVGSKMLTALTYIDQYITENISIDLLAKIVNLSVPRFHLNFRKQVGAPPQEYILRQKINYAKKILLSTSLSITQISNDLSFSSSQYFSTVFKRFSAMTPSEYRNINMKIDKIKKLQTDCL